MFFYQLYKMPRLPNTRDLFHNEQFEQLINFLNAY